MQEKDIEMLNVPLGKLTESGIVLEIGDIVTGRVFEIAKEAQQLFKNKDYDGFRHLIGEAHKELDSNNCLFLSFGIGMTKYGHTIFDMQDRIMTDSTEVT